MNSEQLATLAAHIRANTDPAVVAALATRNDTELARLYNLPAVPEFVVWKTGLSMTDIMEDWVDADWTEVDGLTVGKARIWEWLMRLGTINPSQSGFRAAIIECWKGTSARLAVQARILAQCKRSLSVFERVYATGTGSSGNPGVAVVEGGLPVDWVSDALNNY